MMHNSMKTPVHSEYRHSKGQFQANWFLHHQIKSPFQTHWYQPYVLQEHVTTVAQRDQKTFAYNPNRPHLNIKLDDDHVVRALVDSGSSVCLGDSSLIKHIKAQRPSAPPIMVTNVDKGRRQTLGCYTSKLSVEDELPHPLVNKQINIHMQDNLSSELVLGTDFLANNGAVIDMRTNNVIFLPNELHPVSLSQKPIVCEAFASVIDQEIPLDKIEKYDLSAFAVHPTEDVEVPFMDQKTIHIKIMENQKSMIHKPDTTFMITSGFAPDPQIPEGLYSIDHDHAIRITIKNSSTGTLFLKQNRPIPGIVAHDLTEDYHEPVEITRDTLRALFLKDQTLKAARLAGVMPASATNTTDLAADHPDYVQPTPEQYISSVMSQFEEASSALQASGFEPPGIKKKPTQAPTQAINISSGSEANITTPCEMEIFNFLWLIWDHYIPLSPT